jgi:hypothetical protein
MGPTTFLAIETTQGVTGSTQGFSLLGLIVPLFSGFVGGLVVLYVQTRERNKKEEKERNQELKSLIRIVDLEIAENDDLLRKALTVDTLSAAGAQFNPILELRNLQTRDWDDTKVRLARLADGEHFKDLDAYYRKARDLSALVQRLYNQSTFHAGPMSHAQEQTQQCKAASDAARRESRDVLDG